MAKITAQLPPTIKKVTLFTQTFGLGGAETFLTDLCGEWQRQGVEVEIFTNYQPWQQVLKTQHLTVHHVPFDLDIIGDWKGLLKALVFLPYAWWFYWRAIAQAQNSDCLIFSCFGDKILGTLIAAWQKRPVIWIEFGPMEAVFKKFFSLPKKLYFLVKDQPKLIITSSLHSKKCLINGAQIKPNLLAQVPCGRKVLAKVKTSIKEKNKINAPTITCISRLEPGKGQDKLIQAMVKVRQQFSTARLRIVGEGDWLSALTRQAQQLKIEPSVTFTGRVASMWPEIQRADVIICPSLWQLEGFGMVVIEAMAMAKPVIGFDRGPTNELIAHQQTGLLAKSGDIDDLAKQIIKILERPQLGRQLGQRGLSEFQRRYTIAAVANQYLLTICHRLTI